MQCHPTLILVLKYLSQSVSEPLFAAGLRAHSDIFRVTRLAITQLRARNAGHAYASPPPY